MFYNGKPNLDTNNNQLLGMMAQFIAHDTSFTSTVKDCKFKCPENSNDKIPEDYENKESCYPWQIFSNDSFWQTRKKTCETYVRSIHGPDTKCGFSTRQQSNQVIYDFTSEIPHIMLFSKIHFRNYHLSIFFRSDRISSVYIVNNV